MKGKIDLKPNTDSIQGGGVSSDFLMGLAFQNCLLQEQLIQWKEQFGPSTETLAKQWDELQSLHHDILSNIGHELRTPLTIIQGLSEILLDDDVSADLAQQKDFLEQIHLASQSLGKLVEKSILLTKLKSGYLAIHPQAIDIKEAVERVIEQFDDELSKKLITWSSEFPEDRPLAWADGLCFELALQALMENAIKFNTDGGSICWQGICERDVIKVTVTNSGVGIPSEKLPILFSVFGQVERGSTRRFGGLGLGLPLVKQLIEQIGGQISASSPGPNYGATFTILLPRAGGEY